ncbi:efflux transporter outer membrane subunit [Robbsia sp. KACC 23696]|uniref:efflux transporter outer membrane subunit n=1 Tax=Robbsia sp. KACC 23696 TaxID=3149231 RepID=UPI00325B8FBA
MNERLRYGIAYAVLTLTGAGCTLHAPDTALGITPPPTWRYAPPAAPASAVTSQWWHDFGSAELDRLVAQAAANSFDVEAAVARVQQAQASSRIAGATLLPTVTGFVDGSHQGGFVTNTNVQGTAFDLGLAATYELDFWGRNRAQRDAAVAQLHASEFDRDTVTLTVTADVATTWLQAVSLRERLAIAKQNAQSAADILTVITAQAQAGAATPLELAQQRGLLAAQRRVVAERAQAANDAAASLATLLGMPPSALTLSTDALEPLQVPRVDAGIPSSLLTRRPDLASAEAQLRAADANIVAARAAMLPAITLTGNAGFGNDRLRTLFDSSLYSIAAGLTAPIFDAGSLAAQRDLAVAQKSALLATYRQSIVSAFADVERALNAIAGTEAQQRAQDDELAQAQQALTLAEYRYRAGGETMLVVLNAQQTLYAARDEAVQLKLARLQAAVSLYRALGGGWRQAAQ